MTVPTIGHSAMVLSLVRALSMPTSYTLRGQEQPLPSRLATAGPPALKLGDLATLEQLQLCDDVVLVDQRDVDPLPQRNLLLLFEQPWPCPFLGHATIGVEECAVDLCQGDSAKKDYDCGVEW